MHTDDVYGIICATYLLYKIAPRNTFHPEGGRAIFSQVMFVVLFDALILPFQLAFKMLGLYKH